MKKFSSKMKANSRRTSNKYRTAIVFILGILCLGVLALTPVIAHTVAALVITPVAKVSHWFETSSASFPQYLRNRSDLLDEVTVLRNEIATMRADRYATERLESENQNLRDLLNDADDTRVVAGVIGRPPALPYDVLLLDRGSAAGIVAGAPVFIGKQTVIGVVRSVTDEASVVDLVTSPSFSSLVYIMNSDIYATARGVGGGQIAVGVPQGVSVAVGDAVILPSVSPGIYGLVNHIETRPTQAQQTVYVSPEIPINSLRLVTVATEAIAEPDLSNITATTEAAYQAFLPQVTEELRQATSSLASSTQATTTANATAASSSQAVIE